MIGISQNLRWKEAINQLVDILTNQWEPLQENLKDKGLKYERNDQQWFTFYSLLYVKYIKSFKMLQDSYDRLAHPQKRLLLREMLQSNMVRIFQIKEQLIRYSTSNKVLRSDFVSMDHILEDLRVRHDQIAMYTPRFYKDDFDQDRLKRNQIIDKFLIDLRQTDAPEEEQFVEHSGFDHQEETAIRLIQKIERGRQGIARVMRGFYLNKKEQKRRQRRRLQGQNLDDDGDGLRKQQITSLQKAIRGYLTRKKVQCMRQQQNQFLGLSKKNINPQNKNSEIYKLNTRREQLKKLQRENDKSYKRQIETLKQDLLQKWQQPMKDKMLSQRRMWINQFLQKNLYNKVPNTVKQFYEKDKVKVPLSPQEEQLAAKLAQQKKKQKKGKGKKKKLSERQQFMKDNTKGGPSVAVQRLQQQIQKHTDIWGKAVLQNQGEQQAQIRMVKDQVIPKVEEQVQNLVDDMIQLELANLRIKFKKKKGKGKKKKKAKKAKAIKVPGWKQIQKIPPLDQIGHLVDFGVLKKLAPATIKDLIGQPNLMRPKQQASSQLMPDPSMYDLRQIIVQTICLPLGSQYVRQNITKLHYFLFFGPTGSGKTLMVRAIAHDCDAIVLQLSPMTLQAKINQKKRVKQNDSNDVQCSQNIWTCHNLYGLNITNIQSQKKKKKGSPPAGPNFTKLRKTLTKYKKKVLKKDDRVAVIGCTNKPWQMNKKFIKPFVQKKYYFPFPNYATRKALFEFFMEKKGVKLPQTFPVTTIAHSTQGCTAGNFKQAIDKVAYQRRLLQMKQKEKSRPFNLIEFIKPIANQPSTYIQQYQKFREFNDQVTGLKLRRDKLKAIESGDVQDQKKTSVKKKK